MERRMLGVSLSSVAAVGEDVRGVPSTRTEGGDHAA